MGLSCWYQADSSYLRSDILSIQTKEVSLILEYQPIVETNNCWKKMVQFDA